jgi:DNA repair exonuclease SbcCD ATPase subunit
MASFHLDNLASTAYNSPIELINGEIFKLKNEGVKIKDEYTKFINSPKCPTCGQKIVGDEHKDVFDETSKKMKDEMFRIADKIKQHQNVDIVEKNKIIDQYKLDIDKIERDIVDTNLKMDNNLKELGELTNAKNDVLKRKEIQSNVENVKLKIEIEKNKIKEFKGQIENYNNNLRMIDENKKNNDILKRSRSRISTLNDELLSLNNKISEFNNELTNNTNKIKEIQATIKDFKIQERNDMIENLYKKCVHRDGIPKQILGNYIVPKINEVLKEQLNDMPFIVWLDETDFKPKLTYKNKPKSTINAIGSSGKERTFSSLSLKQALTSVNKKSKPKIFLLDEVTGKLVEESVDEFIRLVKDISGRINKLIIIEHTHEIEPDYIIDVTKSEDDVSTLIVR